MTRSSPTSTFVLTACLVLPLAACGRGEPAPVAPPGAAAPSAKTAEAAPAATPAAAPSSALPAGVAEALGKAGVDPSSVAPLAGRGGTPLLRFRVAGDRAVAVWESLRGAVDATRHWPVITGAEPTDLPEDERTPAAVLDAARKLDFRKWVAGRLDESPEDFEADEGEWPRRQAANEQLTVPLEIGTGRPLPTVWLVLVPTVSGWEVPAYLPFGDWNECPSDEVHVAALHEWSDAWGAELACLSHDTIELRVAKRPATREAASALAREQFVYCVDTVQQGLDTLNALAFDRMTSPVWFFWWD